MIRFVWNQQVRRRRPSNNQPVSIVRVMTAILRTIGPVLTHIAVRRNGSPIFRRVSIELFKEAAKKLEAANLGTIVEMRLAGGKPSVVFIKKPPADVQEILEVNPGFISPSDYAQKYNSPMLSSIPPTMAGELLSKGLVPPEFFWRRVKYNKWSLNYVADPLYWQVQIWLKKDTLFLFRKERCWKCKNFNKPLLQKRH